MRAALFFLCFLMLTPSISQAGVFKCTNAAGVVSYSDSPCATKEGEKPAAVNNVAAFSSINSREEDKKIAQACNSLLERKRSCGYDSELNSKVWSTFVANCEVPIKRDALEKEREQRDANRNRGYRNKDYKDYLDEKLEKLDVKLQCNELAPGMWKFVKENFSAKLTAKEISEIELGLGNVPPPRSLDDALRKRYTKE